MTAEQLHDLRTSLGIIRNSSEVLRDIIKTSGPEFLQMIITHTEKITAIIDQDHVEENKRAV